MKLSASLVVVTIRCVTNMQVLESCMNQSCKSVRNIESRQNSDQLPFLVRNFEKLVNCCEADKILCACSG